MSLINVSETAKADALAFGSRVQNDVTDEIKTALGLHDNARAHGLPAQMFKNTYASIRRTHFDAHISKLFRREHTPAKCHLEARVEEMNEGELRAEMCCPRMCPRKKSLQWQTPGGPWN